MQIRTVLLAVLLTTATACSARAGSLQEGVSASLKQGDLINWRAAYEISFFSSPPEAANDAALAQTVGIAIRAKEVRLGEAYDYLLNYKQLPRISVSGRDLKVRWAYEVLNQRALCPRAKGYRICKAFESDEIFREQWSKAASQQPQNSAKIKEIEAHWNTLGHRREVAIAQTIVHNLITLDPDFLFFDIQQDFLAYRGSWIDGSVGPLTLIDLSQIGDAKRWKPVEADGHPTLYTLARLQRPWFDAGIASLYFWTFNRASPAGPGLKLANGVDCTLPLGCVPQWVILARSNLSAPAIQVLGTIDVRSGSLPGDQNDWRVIGKENISRGISIDALLDALDSASF